MPSRPESPMRQLSPIALTAVTGRLWPGRLPVPSAAAVSVGLSAAAVVLWVVGHLETVRVALTGYDVLLIDGTFQLFNPLRRIAAGQRGGVDFQFFHGIGVPYLHYPLFALLGGDLSASEWTRQLVSLAAGVLGYGLPLWAFTRRPGAAVVLLVPALLLHDALGLSPLSAPGNSLLGVRAFMPMVVFAVLLAGFGRAEPLLAGAAAGAAMLTGTEQGVAATAGLLAVWLGRTALRLPGGGWRYAVAAAGTLAATASGLLLLIGGPAGLVGALRYAFVQVPADQFWYFGAPPNPFVASPGQLACDRHLLPTLGKVLVLAAAAGWWAVGRPFGPAGRDKAVVLVGLAVYAGLSTVGYLGVASDVYTHPARRVCVVAGLAVAWAAVQAARTAGPAVFAYTARLSAAFAACLLVTGWGEAGMSVQKALWPRLEPGPRPAPLLSPVRLAANPEAHFRTLAEWVREHGPADRPPVVWSEYASLLEADLGTFHPHCDYIIHVLGPDARAEYVARFRQADPDFVVTFRMSYTPYTEWLRLGTWPFYEVARNYEPIGQTFAATLWKRTAAPWRPAGGEWEHAVPASPTGDEVVLPPGPVPGEVVVVEARYEVENRWEKLPLLGKTPRHVVTTGGTWNVYPTALPNYERAWTWAGIVRGDAGPQTLRLQATQGPLGIGDARLTGAAVRRLQISQPALRALFTP